MSTDVGVNPDLNYLSDPQQQDTFPGRCDCCGHLIHGGERFYELELCTGLVRMIHKAELIVCADCKAEMELSERLWEDIRYA